MKKLILLALTAVIMVGCIESKANYFDDRQPKVVTLFGCEYILYEFYTSGHWEKIYIHKGNCCFCKERREKEIKELLKQLNK